MNEFFKNLTESDRHNLCDIAWFIKGLNFRGHSSDSPFGGDHEQTLEKVIRGISTKVSDENRAAKASIKGS